MGYNMYFLFYMIHIVRHRKKVNYIKRQGKYIYVSMEEVSKYVDGWQRFRYSDYFRVPMWVPKKSENSTIWYGVIIGTWSVKIVHFHIDVLCKGLYPNRLVYYNSVGKLEKLDVNNWLFNSSINGVS